MSNNHSTIRLTVFAFLTASIVISIVRVQTNPVVVASRGNLSRETVTQSFGWPRSNAVVKNSSHVIDLETCRYKTSKTRISYQFNFWSIGSNAIFSFLLVGASFITFAISDRQLSKSLPITRLVIGLIAITFTCVLANYEHAILNYLADYEPTAILTYQSLASMTVFDRAPILLATACSIGLIILILQHIFIGIGRSESPQDRETILAASE